MRTARSSCSITSALRLEKRQSPTAESGTLQTQAALDVRDCGMGTCVVKNDHPI
jgi:hypothetical protein